jgi:3-keto-5-aminohexanoate cleavage enzyme
MMKNKIDWDKVNSYIKNGEMELAICHLYGLPDFFNPYASAYAPGVELQPKWDIPKKVAICCAITGSVFSKKANPHHPISPEEILADAFECCEAGASNIHLHVRDESGYNALDLKRFHQVIDPIREKYPNVVVCGCVVPFAPGDWERMEIAFREGLLDQTPVNTTAVYIGDTLFAKPPHAIIKKAELCERYDVKPQIAIYSDGDIDNARRYLIAPGVLRKPYSWILLPGIVGCSPMYSSLTMVDTLMGQVRRIREIDEDPRIIVCAGGRASFYLATLSLVLGLNIRVGKEDTIWQYPHRDDLIESNAEVYERAVTIARALAREPATPGEYVELMGLRRIGGKVIKK